MYFVPPRNRPVGASEPGSLKSFKIALISSGLNYITSSTKSNECGFDKEEKAINMAHDYFIEWGQCTKKLCYKFSAHD